MVRFVLPLHLDLRFVMPHTTKQLPVSSGFYLVKFSVFTACILLTFSSMIYLHLLTKLYCIGNDKDILVPSQSQTLIIISLYIYFIFSIPYLMMPALFRAQSTVATFHNLLYQHLVQAGKGGSDQHATPGSDISKRPHFHLSSTSCIPQVCSFLVSISISLSSSLVFSNYRKLPFPFASLNSLPLSCLPPIFSLRLPHPTPPSIPPCHPIFFFFF